MSHAPGGKHWDASSHLLRYIATTADCRITYVRTADPLYYHVDSDFLPNYGTSFDNRRSTVDDWLLRILRRRLHPPCQ